MAKGEKRQGEKQHSEKAVRKVTAAESRRTLRVAG